MSILRKVPYIEGKLALLSAEQLASVKTCINASTPNITGAKINNLPNGVANAVEYTFQDGNVKTGILVKATGVCMLLCYHRFQDMQIYELDTTNYKENKINEYLDINELRRVLDDTEEHGGDAWVEDMKQVLVHDSEENEVQCGVHFYCDGDLETGTDVVCGRDLIVDSLQNIQDPNGNAFIPDNMGHAGQFLKAGTTGLVWDTPFVNNNKVVAMSESAWQEFVPQVGIVYAVYNEETHVCTMYYYAS